MGKYFIELLTAVTVLVSTIFSAFPSIIDTIKEITSEDEVSSSGIIQQQHFFNNKEEIVEYAGIDYVRYELSSLPSVAGFQVIAYPYLKLNIADESIYLPLLHQYTQEQYAADEAGDCVLLRENTTEEILNFIRDYFPGTGIEAQAGCFLAIEYAVTSKETKIELYELRNGQLVIAEQETVIKIVDAIEKEDRNIDVQGWPGNKAQIAEQISGFF